MNNDCLNCMYCKKSFKRIPGLRKHQICCELIHNNTITIDDPDLPTPTQKQLYLMVIELGKKCVKLEEKVKELSSQQIKPIKINIADKLNTIDKPIHTFEYMLSQVTVTDTDIEYLFDNTIYDTFHKIFKRTLDKIACMPIISVDNKSKIFYVYCDHNNIDISHRKWEELNKDMFIKFTSKIIQKITNALFEWQNKHQDKIHNNDCLAIKCDKTLIKIMNLEITHDHIIAKLKHLIQPLLTG